MTTVAFDSTVAGPRQAVAAAQARADVAPADVLILLAVLAGELLVTFAGMTELVVFPLAIAAHLVLIAGLVIMVFARRKSNRDLTVPLFTLIAVSAAGPVGALATLIALALLSLPAQSSSLLDDWYHRISLSTAVDAETRLSDRVSSGRVLKADAPAPQALVSTIVGGTMHERQAALGLIARFFHPNHLAALSLALRCEEPVIRVQAAAVAARIRPRLAEDVAGLVSRAGGVTATTDGVGAAVPDIGVRLDTVRHLDAAIASGLLDPPMREAATKAADLIVASIDVIRVPVSKWPSLEDRARIEILESRLIASRNFKALRVLRLRRRLAGSGYMLVRHRPARRRPGKPVPKVGR